MTNYNSLKNAAILNPVANTDLGSPTNTYGNLFMSGNVSLNGTLLNSTNAIAPRIASITYAGNDTAVDPAGGQTITLNGSGFIGSSVYVGGTIASEVTIVTSTQLTFTAPEKTAGSYSLNVVNTDGAAATFVPGIQYSGMPTWSTSSGSLGSPTKSSSVNITVTATSDSAVSYSVVSGSLPSGLSLNTSTGAITGTAPNVSSTTTYNFTIRATDAQNQDTDRNFSITVTGVAPGQQAFTSLGGTSWTVPTGVTTVCAVLIGPGSSHPTGGGGGALRYINNLPVTPGETLEVYVGWSDFMGGSRDTYIKRGSNILVYAGGGGIYGSYNYLGGTFGSTLGEGPYGGTVGGGNGGDAGGDTGGGGGGAGGYSGNGGRGANAGTTATAGTGGGGGGGGKGSSNPGGGGGGGVGLFGETTNGSAGSNGYYASGGGGGSGGAAGETSGYNDGANGGTYGGGGGGGEQNASYTVYYSGAPAQGAARIIWGAGRAFPSTLTTDQS